MTGFAYLEPETLDECVEMLVHHGPAARLLAGGTDLVVQLRERAVRPRAVVSLARLPALRYLARDGDGGLAIGAMTTLREVERAGVLTGPLALIRQGAAQVGCVQVRNVATLGGNACNASPSADTLPPLIAAGAEVRLVGPAGERRMPLEHFLRGPGATAAEGTEVLHGFRVPPPPPLTGGVYLKYAARGSADLAIVGVAARVTLDERERIRAARIVLGAVGPTPLRARRAETLLAGLAPTAEVIEEAARVAAGEASPISDQRASADYRRRMVVVWTRSALQRAIQEARGTDGPGKETAP